MPQKRQLSDKKDKGDSTVGRRSGKTQLVVDPKTKAVICTTFAAGRSMIFTCLSVAELSSRKRQAWQTKAIKGL